MLATLRSLGVTPDFLIYHRYPKAPGAESDSGLAASSSTWATDAADLRQQLNDYLGAAASAVELVCTENNSVYSNPGKQTTSLVNGLFLADSLCAAMKTEFNGVIWWDLRNGQETGNNNSSSLYGWRAVRRLRHRRRRQPGRPRRSLSDVLRGQTAPAFRARGRSARRCQQRLQQSWRLRRPPRRRVSLAPRHQQERLPPL